MGKAARGLLWPCHTRLVHCDRRRRRVAQNLAVLYAFDPIYGVEFLASHGLIGLITLGAVFLAVTGSEALYADLGHFGRDPIRTAWLTVALPALTINYL